ncbi:MAG: hypothetical protein ACPIOQ_53795, partial [Promethearchaeia archaeon]
RKMARRERDPFMPRKNNLGMSLIQRQYLVAISALIPRPVKSMIVQIYRGVIWGQEGQKVTIWRLRQMILHLLNPKKQKCKKAAQNLKQVVRMQEQTWENRQKTIKRHAK